MNFKKETILKALILLGLIAIVVSSYIQYGAPYLHERSLQKLDEKRISDLDSLDVTLKGILKEDPKISFGKSNTVYISIPSNNPTCTDLNLPSLPDSWQYHCVTTSTLQNTDGTGWLPISFPASQISTLPLDPVNNADTLNYYAFVTNKAATSTRYVITAVLASKKYLAEQPQDSNDPIQYEVGNDLSLWVNATGLIGYWPFDDGSGNFAADKSGISGSINLLSNNLFSSSGCFLSSCISSKTGQIALAVPWSPNISKGANVSYSFRFAFSKTPASNALLFNPGTYRLDTNIEGGTGALFVWFYDNTAANNQIYKSSPGQFTDGKWHQIFVTKDPDSITVYMDGQELQDFGTNNSTQQDLPHALLNLIPGMSVNDLRAYNRALSAQEVAEEFSSNQ